MKTDTAELSGIANDARITATLHYGDDGSRAETFVLDLCSPDSPECGYWTAANGVCRAFIVRHGSTCIATIERILEVAGLCSRRPDSRYVIWAPQKRDAATVKRWTAKWSQRTKPTVALAA